MRSVGVLHHSRRPSALRALRTIAVNERDHVRKVRMLVVPCLNGAIELRKGNDRDIEILGHRLLRATG